MTYRIRCYTLFDIEKTGFFSRKPPTDINDAEIKEWETKRNKQFNLDTILQLISLRSQPEEISEPIKFEVDFKKFNNFGFLFDEEENQLGWQFDFSIAHKNVFNNESSELGELFLDCDNVPMILTGNEWSKLAAFLSTSPEIKNIHFEVISSD